MEKFIVSARKYRPQTFDTVVGQSHITTTLKNAIRHEQLAHAFLFCGPRGVGKTTCARILAKTINCENQTSEGEACNTCQSCQSFNDGASMNYFELDGASNNSVDNIRDLVDQVRFVPQTGKYKVYVIDEVHMLSSSAFNAFLKTLEEPPPYAIFILATTEKHKILPTILSRCQIFDFKRISTADTVKHLEEICAKEAIKADKAALQVIAQKSEGCMRDALSILDKIVSFTNGELDYNNTLEHLNILDADCYFKLLDCMQEQDLSGAMLLYDDINKKGFEGDLVLNGFSEFIRNLLVCKDEKAAGLLEVVENFREKYITTAKKTDAVLLISSLNILSEAEINYKAARNKRLHVELALIKLCYLRQAIHLTADGNSLGKKKIVDAAKPLAFRQILPFQVKEPAKKNSTDKEAKLIIEAPSRKEISKDPGRENSPTGSELQHREQQPVSANLSAEAKANAEATVDKPDFASASSGKPATGKISPLDKIRKQYQSNGTNGNNAVNQSLIQEELEKAWSAYTLQLKEAKNPAAQPFELAFLRIKDGNCFEAVVSNTIEKQFLEQERNKLFTYLQEKLKNRLLQFNVIIEEKSGDRPAIEITLTSKEQYQKMTGQYPLVRELKERLNLTLDY
ncbi:MAG: DNA polymerase III subunit gamma/tau [Chitinophagaceae bacterium]